MRRRDLCGVLLLLVYFLGVGLVTGPSLYQLLVWHLPTPRLELVPFSDIISVWTDTSSPGLGAFANIVGNLALLAPLGFLLPLFWRYFHSIKHTVLFAAGLSLSIELIQLVAGGVTSVDDLVLNTAGAAIGFLLAKLLLQMCPRFSPQQTRSLQWVYPLACWFAVIVLYTGADCIMLS